MTVRIVISGRSSPANQIEDQLRGIITTGQLASGERLPSVRQLARDLNVAPGTVARAYKALEAEELIVTRIGAGTRVSDSANDAPRDVLVAARKLAATGKQAGMTLEEVHRVLGAVWGE